MWCLKKGLKINDETKLQENYLHLYLRYCANINKKVIKYFYNKNIEKDKLTQLYENYLHYYLYNKTDIKKKIIKYFLKKKRFKNIWKNSRW